jgi:hypothetical protein
MWRSKDEVLNLPLPKHIGLVEALSVEAVILLS